MARYYKFSKLILVIIILVWCVFNTPVAALPPNTLIEYFYPITAYDFQVTNRYRGYVTYDGNVSNIAGPPDGSLFTITMNETDPGSYAHWELTLDMGTVLSGDNVILSVLSASERISVTKTHTGTGEMSIGAQFIDISLDGTNWTNLNRVWTCNFDCDTLNWHHDVTLGSQTFRFLKLRTSSHHGSHKLTLNSIRLWDAVEKPVDLRIIAMPTKQQVDTLTLTPANWPTPNPLEVQVLLTCTLDPGQWCDYNFKLEMQGSRHYLLDWDVSEAFGTQYGPCVDRAPNGGIYSYTLHETVCVIPVEAQQSVLLKWWVMAQPANSGNLDITAIWNLDQDSKSIAIPQADIKPLIIIPGFMGTYPAQNGGKLDPLLKVYDNLIIALQRAGYELGDPGSGATLVGFGYDWRQPIVDISDIPLRSAIEAIQNTLIGDRREYADYSQVDIIAHSMGGLVARAYAEEAYVSNQQNINKLITVASPHKGSPPVYRGYYSGISSAMGMDSTQTSALLTGLAVCENDIDLHFLYSDEDITFYQNSLFEYMKKHVPSVKQMLPVLDIPKPYLVENTSPYTNAYPYERPDNFFLEDLNTVDGAFDVSKLSQIPQVIASFSTSKEPHVVFRVNPPPYTQGDLYPSGYGQIISGSTKVFKDSSLLGDDLVPAYSANLKEIRALSTTTNIVERDENKLGDKPSLDHMSIIHKPEMIRRFVSLLTEQDITPHEVFWSKQYQPPSFLSMAFAIITCSPVNTLVTDPQGRQIGLDLTTGQVINEIPGAAVSDAGTEPHIILVPQIPGQYQVQSIGTGVGDYKVFAMNVNEYDIKPQLVDYVTGTITISETVEFSFNVTGFVHLPIILK